MPMSSVIVPMLFTNAMILTPQMFSAMGTTVKKMAMAKSVQRVPSQPKSPQAIGAAPKATPATVTRRAKRNIQAVNQPQVPLHRCFAHW